MANILITGATGYIGGKLAEYYYRKNANLTLLVHDQAKLLPIFRDKCRVFIGDVTRPETLAAAMDGNETLISSAGLLGHWGISYERLYQVNVVGVENLLRAALDAGVHRIIHLSAGGVTGPVGLEPADETYPAAPRTDYERTKWEGEKRALGLAHREQLDVLILRPTFTYGPGDPHKLDLFRSIQKGHFFFIGNPESTTHPLYIDDLIRGVDLALESTLSGLAVIIGGAEVVSKRRLMNAIADALGVRRPTLRVPVGGANTLATGFEWSARFLGFSPPLTHSRVTALSGNWGYSIDRARRELGFQPEVDLEEGIRRTVAWYREHGWL